MQIIRTENYEEMSKMTADLLAEQILLKPDCVLGLATGSTPVGTYDQLIKKYEAGSLDFHRVTTINLDEYRGLSPENTQSYRYFMNKHLLEQVNIPIGQTFVPNGLEPDPEKACSSYEALIRTRGGIDLQLLGLGNNGHIGFNEPADSFPLDTHLVDLTESTILANARFFATIREVPKQAYTMGIRTIMQARRIVIIVNGTGKAEIVKKAFFGPVTPRVPASILQMHPNVTLIGDRDALSEV